MVLLATGLVALAFMLHGTRLVTIAAPMFLFGVGYGLFQSPNNRTILGSAPRNRTGAAQGILATARLTGQTTGAALVALLFAMLARGPRHTRVPLEHEITVARVSRSLLPRLPRSRAHFAAQARRPSPCADRGMKGTPNGVPFMR